MEMGLAILCLLWDSTGHDPEFGQLLTAAFCEGTFVYALEITDMSISTALLSLLWQ